MEITLQELAQALASKTQASVTATPGSDLLAPLVGEKVFIRTVTYHYTGQVVSIDAATIVLMDAAWIADSGRWATALETGTLSEVEPYPAGTLVYISRAATVDVTVWGHALPRTQK
jgi:hypothetical protein